MHPRVRALVPEVNLERRGVKTRFVSCMVTLSSYIDFPQSPSIAAPDSTIFFALPLLFTFFFHIPPQFLHKKNYLS